MWIDSKCNEATKSKKNKLLAVSLLDDSLTLRRKMEIIMDMLALFKVVMNHFSFADRNMQSHIVV